MATTSPVTGHNTDTRCALPAVTQELLNPKEQRVSLRKGKSPGRGEPTHVWQEPGGTTRGLLQLNVDELSG